MIIIIPNILISVGKAAPESKTGEAWRRETRAVDEWMKERADRWMKRPLSARSASAHIQKHAGKEEHQCSTQTFIFQPDYLCLISEALSHTSQLLNWTLVKVIN